MVTYDYTVYHEGACDPYSESCFALCLDDECTEEVYYSDLERRADVLIALCGDNILDCDAAWTCGEEETECTMTYCNPNNITASCEVLTEADRPLEDDSLNNL